MRVSDFERIVAAADIVKLGVPDDVNLRILEQPILQNLFGTQRVSPMHQRDLGGEIGEKQRLLDGDVAAAVTGASLPR